MLRLLLYSHFFAPSIGGVETVVRDLAEGLASSEDAAGNKRFAVTVMTRTSAGSNDDSDLPYRVLRCPSLTQLWGAVRSADVVHVAGTALGPMLAGLLARKPVVVEHHGFQVVCPNGQYFHEITRQFCPGHFMAGHRDECLRCCGNAGKAGAWRLWLLTHVRRFLCRFAARHIMPTSWLATQLRLQRAATVLHGVPDSETSAAAPARPVPRFVFVGRFVPSKGVHLLLQAAQILQTQGRHFEVQIIGDGPERAALEASTAESDSSGTIRFQHGLPDSEVAASLSRATALVAPSLAGEVFGMVLAETMSRGVPVIASNLGSFAEVVQDGGLLFKSGDAADLAQQMARLLDEPSLHERLSSNARRRASTALTIHQMVEGHATLYEQVRGTNT